MGRDEEVREAAALRRENRRLRAREAELLEEGRRLASERESLVAAGADPAALEVPLAPEGDFLRAGGVPVEALPARGVEVPADGVEHEVAWDGSGRAWLDGEEVGGALDADPAEGWNAVAGTAEGTDP
jgi:hypothetical protein